MSRRVQHLRGNTAWNDAFIGNDGEFTYDTQAEELRLHNGTTPGGKKVPNIDTIPTLSRAAISGDVAAYATTNLTAGDMDKLLNISVADDYVLPDRAALIIGTHVYLTALVSGVSITAFDGSQAIRDKGVNVTSRTLNQYETIHLVLRSLVASAAWHVLSSY